MATGWVRQARLRQRRWSGGSAAAGAMRWEASEALADWLAAYPWDHFATFTTAPGHGEESLLRLHRRWSGRMHVRVGRQLRQAVFLEGHRDGRPHLHGLCYGSAGVDHLEQENLWTEVSAGIARVRVFRDGGGACEYCVKGARYVSKEGRAFLLGPWRALDRAQLALFGVDVRREDLAGEADPSLARGSAFGWRPQDQPLTGRTRGVPR